MTVIVIIAIVILLIVLGAFYELHHLKVTEYVLTSKKLSGDDGINVVFLSDLHHRRYGKDNEKLVELMKSCHPDFIFLGGDMTLAKESKDDSMLISLLQKISKIAPVFYAAGNHEREMMEYPDIFQGRFEKIKAVCAENGIRFISNECAEIADKVSLYALDCEYRFYDKKNPVKNMEVGYIKDKLNIADKNRYNILLSHNPRFFETYVQTDVDLVLSGHYHGGAVRLGKRGVISPQFRLFPKYSYGRFQKDRTTMIVTGGAGTHTLNLRLFNKPEIVNIKISGAD